MNAQELIYAVEDAQFKTKEEWLSFRDKAFEIFNQLPPKEQEIILEDNSFEMLSMICSAFEK